MPSSDSDPQCLGHFGGGLPGPAEGQHGVRQHLVYVGQLAAGGGLVPVHRVRQRGEDLGLWIGLGRVVELDTVRQRGPHGGRVRA